MKAAILLTAVYMQGMNKPAVLSTERQQSNHAACSSAVMFNTLKCAEQASAESL